MILDLQNLLSDQQAVTTTALSTNTIDLGATGTNVFGSTPISDPGRAEVGVFAQVTTQFTGGTSMQAQLVTADDAALSTNLTVIQETTAIPLATLVPGYQFRLSDLPPGITQRYLGIKYVVVGTMTGGKVSAGLIFDRQTNPKV